MNLGNKLAVGEVHDHGADHGTDHDAEVAPVEVVTPTVRVEAPPEPVSQPVPAHAD
jgi:hypothetical protein